MFVETGGKERGGGRDTKRSGFIYFTWESDKGGDDRGVRKKWKEKKNLKKI